MAGESLPEGLDPGAGDVTLAPSRGRLGGLLTISLLFAIAGVVIAASGGGAIGWLAILFGGAGTIVFALQLRPGGSYLHLDSDGFEERTLYRPSRTAWSEVEAFRPYEVSTMWGVTSKKVGFDYVGKHRGAGVARSMTGVEGGLDDNYGLKAQQLAEVMNAWREKYAGPAPGQAEI